MRTSSIATDQTSRIDHGAGEDGVILAGDSKIARSALLARSDRLAGGLQALGLRAGDSVAILIRNDPVFLEVSYGAMKLGAYAVPINWNFKADEVGLILRDCAAPVLVGHADLIAGIRSAIPPGVTVLVVATPPDVSAIFGLKEQPILDEALGLDYETWLRAQSDYDGPAVAPPQSMIYTSGTTGRPKGVRRMAPTAAQRATSEQLRKLVYGLAPGMRALLPGPLYHSAPNSFAGQTGRIADILVLMRKFEPELCLHLIERHRITTMFMVPTMFVRMLKLPQDVRQKYDLSSLQHVIHAAAPCAPEVKRAMIDWWGPVIWEFYGSTEAGSVTLASSEDALQRPGTVGRAVPGADIRIVDSDGRTLPPGERGEIYTRIEGLVEFTYHNNPAERSRIDLDGYVTSGDVGYLDNEGYLFICDRKRDMIIAGGVNIYPAEIEGVMLTLPGVLDCAVFGIPDDVFGESVMAVVEPQKGVTLDLSEIRRALAERLADYKLPKRLEVRANLPREDSGKIMKRILRDPFWTTAGRRI